MADVSSPKSLDVEKKHNLTRLKKATRFIVISVLDFAGENTFCVVADKMSIKVRNIVSKGVYDVVKVDWLLRCIEQQQLLPWYVAVDVVTMLK